MKRVLVQFGFLDFEIHPVVHGILHCDDGHTTGNHGTDIGVLRGHDPVEGSHKGGFALIDA